MSTQSIVLDEIPFRGDIQALRSSLGLAESPDGELQALVSQARGIARPRAMYRPCFVDERGESHVVIEGAKLTSRILRVNLEEAHRVFPFVCTCGRELADWWQGIADPLARYWAEAIAELAAREAFEFLFTHIDGTYRLEKASFMNPGSLEDWPITEQGPLFTLLGDVESRIGVVLTESFLMLPVKSISGIRFPLQTSFESCMLCPRDVCENRRAPYDPGLAGSRYGAQGPDA